MSEHEVSGKRLTSAKIETLYYSCNGSIQGCERERFGMCDWHECQENGKPARWPDMLRELLDS